MASPHTCAQLVDQFPHLVRARRALVRHTPAPGAATLAAVVETGTPSVSELAATMGLDLSTVSRQVTQLRRQGWVDASRDADDGRSQRLRATPAGLDALRAERRRLVDVVATRLNGWDDAEVAALTTLLGRLATDVQTDPAPLPQRTA